MSWHCNSSVILIFLLKQVCACVCKTLTIWAVLYKGEISKEWPHANGSSFLFEFKEKMWNIHFFHTLDMWCNVPLKTHVFPRWIYFKMINEIKIVRQWWLYLCNIIDLKITWPRQKIKSCIEHSGNKLSSFEVALKAKLAATFWEAPVLAWSLADCCFSWLWISQLIFVFF